MKIMSTLIVMTSVVLLTISFGAEAKKSRVEIQTCVCDEQADGSYDCTVDYTGAAPAGDGEYHAHVTTEQDGVLDSDGITQASCKTQTECQGIAGTFPDYTATCTGAPLPDGACTALLQDGFFFGIVAKVAADPDGNHGKATRSLKDNFPNCTINPFSPDPECAGQTCGNFTACNEGGSCGSGGICGSTAEGGGLCIDGSTPCAGLTACPNGTSDCATGETCLVDTCCGPAFCVADTQYCSAPAPAPTSGLPLLEQSGQSALTISGNSRQ